MGPIPDCAIENHPLAPATFFKIGGPARWALFPRGIPEAVEAYEWMMAQPDRKLILARGSNVLIADEGFPGIVLFTDRLDGLDSLGDDAFNVEGGVGLDRLVRDIIVPNNYEGTGALTGIPGSVGGAIFMNAGTANGVTCELVESVELLTPAGPRTVPMEPSLYSYRSQSFCTPNDLILSAVFRFRRSGEDQRAIHDHYIERRNQKQPHGDCCGSVFKNPPGDHAGRLIEACALKGVRRGGATISAMHANFIINESGATCADVLWLIALCKRKVRERFGIELREEVRIVPGEAVTS